jgi:hypothetical protein
MLRWRFSRRLDAAAQGVVDQFGRDLGDGESVPGAHNSDPGVQSYQAGWDVDQGA